MKIRADEHVSAEIVRAVREMALSPGWELSHVIQEGDGGQDDDHWITRFSKQGGHAILSADTDFLKIPQQVMAVCDTGMKIIHLPYKWANAKCYLQAAHILLWWRRIETTLVAAAPRQCWRPDWNISEGGELKRITVDYEGARRKLRKAHRDSRREAREGGAGV